MNGGLSGNSGSPQASRVWTRYPSGTWTLSSEPWAISPKASEEGAPARRGGVARPARVSSAEPVSAVMAVKAPRRLRRAVSRRSKTLDLGMAEVYRFCIKLS